MENIWIFFISIIQILYIFWYEILIIVFGMKNKIIFRMKFKDYFLNYSDEHSEEFWYAFFRKIEEVLSDNNISPNGLAKGDKKLGKYVSIRNEAYIRIYGPKGDEDVYPPDNYGWNAANQNLPFNLKKFEKKSTWKLILISLIILSLAYLLCK